MNGFDAFDHHVRSLNVLCPRVWQPPLCESCAEGANGLMKRLLLRRPSSTRHWGRWDSNASRLVMSVAKS